jgi:hypothetical protein
MSGARNTVQPAAGNAPQAAPFIPLWLKILLSAALISVVVAGLWFYNVERRERRKIVVKQLQTVAKLKVQEIAKWRVSELKEGDKLLNSPFFCEAAAQWLANPEPDLTEKILQKFRSLQASCSYREIQLLDADGQVRLSMTGQQAGTLQDEHVLQVLTIAMRDNRPVMTDLHTNPDGTPCLCVVAPIFQPGSTNDHPVGAVVLKCEVTKYLYPLLKSWPLPSNSEETLLVRRDGDHVLFLNNTRFQPEAGMRYRFPLTETNRPAVMAVLNHKGVVEGIDYRNKKVVAYLEEIPDSSWHLVTKMDEHDALRVWRSETSLILDLLLASIVTLCAIWLFFWQRNQKVHFQRLLKSEQAIRATEQRFRNTLENLQLIALTLDRGGCITFANSHLLELTGWQRDQITGASWFDSFIPAGQRDDVKKFFHDSIISGELPVQHENEIETREGVRRLIRWNNTMLHDAEGNVIGTASIGEDITEHRRHENLQAARLRLLAFAQTHTLNELLQATLDEAQKLTGSQAGFYHFLEADQNTLSLQAWSPRTPESIRNTEGAGMHYPVDQAGAWADCIHQQRPVIHNDLASLPHRKELPPGHAVLVRDLAVPVRRGNKITAILGVGNKPADYTEEDVKSLDELADSIWDIVEQKRTEEAMAQSENRFTAIFQKSPVAIVISRLSDGQYVDVNDEAVRLYGYSREELIGHTSAELGLFSADARAQLVAKLCKQGSVVTDVPIRRKSGETIELLTSLQLVKLGDEPCLLSTLIDVTERRRAEATLREREQLLAEMGRMAKVGGWSLDVATGKGQWTEEVARIHDLDPSTPAGKELGLSFYHGESRAKIEAAVEKCIADGTPYDLELEIVSAKGNHRWVRIIGLPIWQNGKVVKMQGSLQDITDRKQAEQVLRNEENFRRKIIEQAAEGMCVCRFAPEFPHLQFTVWNERMVQITGCTMDEINQRGWFETMYPDPDVRSRAVEHSKKLLQGRDLSAEEFVITRPDGQKRTVTISTTRLTPDNSSDKPVDILAFLTDITARKNIEEILRQQAELLDAANDAIIVRTLDDKVKYWNTGAERIYGWNRADAVGHKCSELNHPGSADSRQALSELIINGSWSGELRRTNKSGREMTAFCRWTLLRDEAGKPVEILDISTDITEKKQLESNFLRAQRMEGIGALAGGIAHDLNNILAPIIMSVPILHESTKDPEIRQMIETVGNCARRGADIIRQLLTFARGKPGTRAPLPVRNLIAEMDKLIRETFPRNIEVHFSAPKDIWLVMGDATQIHQALMNLCVNARDAMPDGGHLRLTASNVSLAEEQLLDAPDAKPGDYVCIAVADTGMGIPPEHLGRIFDPFFTTKDIGKGTGLGLATVLGIVRGHEGFVRVRSTVGAGTTFEMFLAATPATPTKMPSYSMSNLPRSTGELILVVDDEGGVRNMMQRLLEKHGYRVLLASEGAAGLAAFNQHRAEITAIITDMMMPGMDGPTMVEHIRKMDPHLPILGMTGIAERAGFKGIDQIALTVLLNKPFAMNDLLSALHSALADSKPASGDPKL